MSTDRGDAANRVFSAVWAKLGYVGFMSSKANHPPKTGTMVTLEMLR